MKRTAVPELLDSDAGNAAEIAGSLADLRMINRWFGSAGIRHIWRWSMPGFHYFAAGSRGMMVRHRYAAPIHPRRCASCCNRPRRSGWSFQPTIYIDWVRLPGRSGVNRVSIKADYDLAI